MGSRRYGFEILLLSTLTFVFVRGDPLQFFNVLDYGAVADDGKTDNSQALLRAWRAACDWEGGKARVWVPPGGIYMVGPVVFEGPCKGPVTSFAINGVLKAPTSEAQMNSEQWITFQYVDGLVITGGAKGTLDGQGGAAWPLNDCSRNPNCRALPISMKLNFVKHARIHHLRSVDSKNSHMVLFGCENVTIFKIRIRAPGDSPNTDGIKLGSSARISIRDSVIGTGDDCVSIGPGSRDIDISNVACGPGHGVSIGSLGRYPNEQDVVGVTVRNCTFRNTTDGLRIKTWASPLPCRASHLTYQDVFMDNVAIPINIDQLYCPHPPCDQSVSSRVRITDVRFKNIWGTTSSDIGVSLSCSQSFPCRDIVVEDINIVGRQGGVRALCSNVQGRSFGHQIPPSCLA